MIQKLQIHLTGAIVSALLVVAVVSNAAAGPVELLPGRWSGWGKMTMDGGEVEKIKCIATYFSEQGGRELRHNLRCASSNYRIDAQALLTVQSGNVRGKWVERTYSTGGDVSGAVAGDGISVNIVGAGFKASLKIETTKCHQKMNIAPQGMGVARIAVDLAKC